MVGDCLLLVLAAVLGVIGRGGVPVDASSYRMALTDAASRGVCGREGALVEAIAAVAKIVTGMVYCVGILI